MCEIHVIIVGNNLVGRTLEQVALIAQTNPQWIEVLGFFDVHTIGTDIVGDNDVNVGEVNSGL